MIFGGSIAALFATVWLTATALGWSGRSRMGFVLALSAGLVWLEPVMKTLKLGQVELLLMALVVWDLSRVNRGRPAGVAIGLAAAVKLVPLIFIVYVVLCGNARAAVRAAVVFTLTVVVGFLVLPAASQTWWFHGQVFHAGHQVNVGTYVNQSLLGLLSRAAGSVGAATPVWIVCATVVFTGGLATAVRLHRLGRPVAGWLVCALTGLLVSPISWDHHWVWVVPMLVCGVHLSLTERAGLRWLVAAGTGVVALIYFGVPSDRTDLGSLIPARLLLGQSSARHALHHLPHLPPVAADHVGPLHADRNRAAADRWAGRIHGDRRPGAGTQAAVRDAIASYRASRAGQPPPRATMTASGRTTTRASGRKGTLPRLACWLAWQGDEIGSGHARDRPGRRA